MFDEYSHEVMEGLEELAHGFEDAAHILEP